MKITIEDCEIEVDCTQCDRLTAQIARLKAERDSFQDFAHKANDAVTELQCTRDLLKAALRWCLDNGAFPTNGVVKGVPFKDPPAHLAAVIAEAVKP